MKLETLTKFLSENTEDENIKKQLNIRWAISALTSASQDKRNLAMKILKSAKETTLEFINNLFDETINN